MRYRIYHNPSARFMRPFADGDVVIEGYEGDIEEPTNPDLTFMERDRATCERIYAKHNADNRPDGQDAPSLSVGDVVILHPGTNDSLAYSVDGIGFVPASFIQVGRIVPGPYRSAIEGVHRQMLAREQRNLP